MVSYRGKRRCISKEGPRVQPDGLRLVCLAERQIWRKSDNVAGDPKNPSSPIPGPNAMKVCE